MESNQTDDLSAPTRMSGQSFHPIAPDRETVRSPIYQPEESTAVSIIPSLLPTRSGNFEFPRGLELDPRRSLFSQENNDRLPPYRFWNERPTPQPPHILKTIGRASFLPSMQRVSPFWALYHRAPDRPKSLYSTPAAQRPPEKTFSDNGGRPLMPPNAAPSAPKGLRSLSLEPLHGRARCLEFW